VVKDACPPTGNSVPAVDGNVDKVGFGCRERPGSSQADEIEADGGCRRDAGLRAPRSKRRKVVRSEFGEKKSSVKVIPGGSTLLNTYLDGTYELRYVR
jgi:hypothetical protein